MERFLDSDDSCIAYCLMTMFEKLPSRSLRGSYVPLVTPFRQGAIDFDAYEQLVDVQVQAHTRGVIVAGSTGDSHLLTLNERKALLRSALRVAAGRMEIIAGTGCETIEDTCELAADADVAGADATLVITPRATPAASAGIAEFMIRAAAATERPVLVYHYPGRTGVRIDIDTLTTVVEASPNVVGLKHTRPDLSLLREGIRRFGPAFRTFVGWETFALPGLIAGASGTILACTNVVPVTAALLYDAVQVPNLPLARSLQDVIGDAFETVCLAPTASVALKHVLAQRRLIADEHRLPLLEAAEPLGSTILERMPPDMLNVGAESQAQHA